MKVTKNYCIELYEVGEEIADKIYELTNEISESIIIWQKISRVGTNKVMPKTTLDSLAKIQIEYQKELMKKVESLGFYFDYDFNEDATELNVDIKPF